MGKECAVTVTYLTSETPSSSGRSRVPILSNVGFIGQTSGQHLVYVKQFIGPQARREERTARV